MSTDRLAPLPVIEIAGRPYDAGAALGRHAAAIANGYLTRTHAWASVMAFRDDPRIAAARHMVEARFPRYWQELRGLADGLGLAFDDVFAWNCRGDVWAMAPDGCTTVLLPGAPPVLAHNEDGHAGLRNGCAIALVRSDGGRPFAAFLYPASLPGHAFAVTGAGLVQTVNNIRAQRAGHGLPRMVLTRAVLDCGGIDEAVGLIRGAARAGAFHIGLAQAGDPRLVSVEFTHSGCSVRVPARPECHANHLVHPDIRSEDQIVTASSRSRQRQGDRLIEGSGGRVLDPLAVLWNGTDAALPVYREQPDDPDDENTLATVLFEIADTVRWCVHDRADSPACHVFEGLTPARAKPGNMHLDRETV
ncbi:MAG: C45 family autoproteolytic acyltransferase/hydrolase [Parvibaculaceae bacterium]